MNDKPSQEDIAKHAYHIWEREGRPHGRDQDHWHAAEREMQGPARKSTATEDRPGGGEPQRSRQTGAASVGRPGQPSSPSTTQAAAAIGKRAQPTPLPMQPTKSAQVQAGQPSGTQAQQSTSGKTEPPAEKSSAPARKPRSTRQPTP